MCSALYSFESANVGQADNTLDNDHTRLLTGAEVYTGPESAQEATK